MSDNTNPNSNPAMLYSYSRDIQSEYHIQYKHYSDWSILEYKNEILWPWGMEDTLLLLNVKMYLIKQDIAI
jgi:hypothetical protein